MLLRGFAIDGSVVQFSLEDAPIVLTDALLALSGKPNSKLICADTVGRGDKDLGVFEGDELIDDEGNLIGVIYYAKGFVVHNTNSSLKKLLSDGHIHLREGTKDSARLVSNLPERTDLMFGYNKKVIFFRSILAKMNGYLCFVDDSRRIAANDIRFFTGEQTEKGESIYYGDFYRGGTVVMRDGVPCIKKLNGECVAMQG